MFQTGDKVEIRVAADSPLYQTNWWPKSGKVTGTVQKVFKNKKIAVAVDQVKNSSEDRRHTMNFDSCELFSL